MIVPGLEFAPPLVVLGFGFLAALPMIGSALGKVFGGASEASAQNQLERQQLEQNRNRQLIDLYGTQQGAQMQQGQLDLQRQAFQSGEEGTRLKRALLGQLLGNAQALDIDIPGIQKPKMTGGLSVNSLGQGGRDIGAEMTARALMQLRAQPKYEGGQILQAPTIAPIGKTGGNGFLNALGTIGSLIGGAGSMFGGQRQQPGATPPGTITGSLPSDFRF